MQKNDTTGEKRRRTNYYAFIVCGIGRRKRHQKNRRAARGEKAPFRPWFRSGRIGNGRVLDGGKSHRQRKRHPNRAGERDGAKNIRLIF